MNGRVTDPVLLLIDMQLAIDDPKWGRRGQKEAEDNAARLLFAWRSGGRKVIHIRHDSSEPASPYHPSHPGNAFKPALRPLAGELVLSKRTNDALIGTPLAEMIEEAGRPTLVICGVLLENSVDATARHAGNLGYDVVIVSDAVASIDRTDRRGQHWPAEDVHALTLALLSGEYARIATVDDMLTELERAA